MTHASSRAEPRWALPLVFVVGVVLRVLPWFAPHTFLGVQEYDDGVYYGAASNLLHGHLPYADFTIVHPPGVSFLLLPFAALGSLFGDPAGMAAARLAVVLMACANVALVYRVATRIPLVPGASRWVPLASAALYAAMPNAVLAEHTVLLEPLVNLLCLLALLCLLKDGRHAPYLAGVLLALAVSVKLFAAAYVVVLLAWLVLRKMPDRAGRVALGVGGGGALFFVPFVVASPHAFWQDVVVTQLSRPLDSGMSRWERLVDMAGLSNPLLLGSVVLLVLVVLTTCRVRREPASAYRMLVLLLVLIGSAFGAAASYFPHYGAFVAVPLALVVGRLVAGRRAQGWLVVGVMVLYVGGAVSQDLDTTGQGDWAALEARIPASSCVFAESASSAVAANHFRPSSADCPSWVDGRGVVYAENTDWPRGRSFYYAGFTGDQAWQSALRNQLAHADFLLLSRPPAQINEWDRATRDFAMQTFSQDIVHDGDKRSRVELWARISPR